MVSSERLVGQAGFDLEGTYAIQIDYLMHSKNLRSQTARRDITIINIRTSIKTKPAARKNVPQKAIIPTVVSVDISLDESITRRDNCREGSSQRSARETVCRLLTSRKARSHSKRINEEMHKGDIASRPVRVGHCIRGKTMNGNQLGVDVVEKIGPDFSNIYPHNSGTLSWWLRNKIIQCGSLNLPTSEYLRGLTFLDQKFESSWKLEYNIKLTDQQNKGNRESRGAWTDRESHRSLTWSPLEL